MQNPLDSRGSMTFGMVKAQLAESHPRVGAVHALQLLDVHLELVSSLDAARSVLGDERDRRGVHARNRPDQRRQVCEVSAHYR